MDANERSKRDLPEVVAEILIEQHAMREDIAGMREELNGIHEDIAGLREDMTGLREDITGMREEIAGLREDMVESNAALRNELRENSAALRNELQESRAEMIGLFNGMTNAILDAMNRGNDRYTQTNERVDRVEVRVSTLENPAADAA